MAFHAYAHSLETRVGKLLTTAIGSYEGLRARLLITVELLERRRNDLDEFGFRVDRTVGQIVRMLSAMRKQTRVSMRTLKHLWELDSERHAADLARELEQVGLCDVEFQRRECGPVEMLRLHDSIYEFAVIESRRHGEEKTGHEALIRGYGRGLAMRDGCREWWDPCVEADGYIHGNLCRHLVGMGGAAELVSLLLSPQWAERQVKISGPLFLEADFSLGVTAVHDEWTDGSNGDRSEIESSLQLISEAVALSSGFIAGNPSEVLFQLHGRIKGFVDSYEPIQQYVSWIETDGKRPSVLCDTSFLGEPGGACTRIIALNDLVLCIVIMQDGKRIACGLAHGEIAVVNVERSLVEKRWQAHDGVVGSIAFDRIGKRLVSGSSHGTVKVWAIETGRCLAIFRGHTEGKWIFDIAVFGDGRRIISVSEDGSAKVWDAETGQMVSMPFTGHGGKIKCVTVMGDGEEVITGGQDKKLRLWNVMTGAQVGGTFDHDGCPLKSVKLTPDERKVVSSDGSTLKVWDIGSHRQIGSSLKGHTSHISCVSLSRDGRRIVSGSYDNTIRVWDLESRKEICSPLEGHTGFVAGVSFLSDAERVVSCSHDGSVRVWDLRREKAKRAADRHGSDVRSVCFTPDGRFVLSASYEFTVAIWDTSSGKITGALDRHSAPVTDVAVAANGKFAVSVSTDRIARVWDLESHEVLQALLGHTDTIYCVSITPQCDHVVTGSRDRTVRVWDLASMSDSDVTLRGHCHPVMRVFVTDDGSRIISVDTRDNVFVWDFDTYKLVKRATRREAWLLSRREVLHLVGETGVQDDNSSLWIPPRSPQILYGEGQDSRVLATMEAVVQRWTWSPDKKTICVGLANGKVGFLRFETKDGQ